jgi:hypothetical protein
MSILAVSFRPRVANHFSGIDDLVETRLVDVPGLESSLPIWAARTPILRRSIVFIRT